VPEGTFRLGAEDRAIKAAWLFSLTFPVGGPYVMLYENDRPIFICRGLRMPLGMLWSKLKRF